MSERFPGLTNAYLGRNAAHRAFRAALANAKALPFVLARRDPNVLQGFLAEAEEASRRSADGNFAIGMAGGRSTAGSVQLGIHLTGAEISLVDAGGKGVGYI